MPTVAEQLRQGREQRKLDVYQVAEITKIKTDHIRALEENNFNCFTAPAIVAKTSLEVSAKNSLLFNSSSCPINN